MNAIEAKRLVEKFKSNDLDEILDEIKKTATSGGSSIYWYKELGFNARQSLIDLGYDVKVDSGYREQYMVTINWLSLISTVPSNCTPKAYAS